MEDAHSRRCGIEHHGRQNEKGSVGKVTDKKSAMVTQKATSGRIRANPVLLSGGNPQIAKADGDAPVQAYVAECRRAQSAASGRTLKRHRFTQPRLLLA